MSDILDSLKKDYDALKKSGIKFDPKLEQLLKSKDKAPQRIVEPKKKKTPEDGG